MGELQGHPHFHGGVEQGTRVGSRWASLGGVSWDIIRIISESFIIQNESGCLAEHQGPFQGLEGSALEIMTTLRPLAFWALAFSSLLGMHIHTRARAGTHASSLSFHSAEEFVGTFQAWKAVNRVSLEGPETHDCSC